MASTYSTSLLLELIGNGDQSGTWGTTTNKNLGTLLEQAIVGQTTVSMNNANYTLSNYNGTSDEARNAVVIITGNQNASYVVNCPAVQKLYIITNSLSASATAYFGPTGGSTLTIANGQTVLAYCTGTTMVALSTPTAVANISGGAASQINYQTASSTTGFIANGTSGQVLQSNGSAAPSWVSSSSINITGNAATANNITNSGGWSVTPSGTTLYFNYNGTNVASLDSSGNLVALANVTAYGTP